METGLSADFTKLENDQYRSVNRFLFLEGKSRGEIKESLDAVYGDSSNSVATVKNWFNEFQRGRKSVFDEPCPGAPNMKTVTTEDNVKKSTILCRQTADCRCAKWLRQQASQKTAWVISCMKYWV